MDKSVNISLQDGSMLQNGRYRVVRMLGRGGFGITYLVIHTLFNRKFALKEFFPQDYCSRDGDTSHITVATVANHELVDRLKARFISEARNIAGLRHSNIVGIHDVFEENGTAYFVMDYIEGIPVDELVRQRGALPEGEALDIIKKVCGALDYLHGRKMIHYDVKPANIIMRESDAEPVLIDFGLSKQYNEKGHAKSTLLLGLSHGYSPLEQYLQDGVTSFAPTIDVYSAGATLYTLLSGRVPPEAPRLVGGPIEVPLNISPEIRRAVQWAMAADASDRCPTIKDFLQALESGSAPELGKRTDGGTVIVEGMPRPAAPPRAAREPKKPVGYQTGKVSDDYVIPKQPKFVANSEPRRSSGVPVWAFVIAAVVIVGLLLYIALRPSDNKAAADEEIYTEVERSSDMHEPGRPVDGRNVMSGEFHYAGADYGFELVFDYDSATGSVTNATYEATAYPGKSKMNDVRFSGNTITVSSSNTFIQASAHPGSSVYEGEMTRGDNVGTCTLVLKSF